MAIRSLDLGLTLARSHQTRPEQTVRVFVADEHRSLARGPLVSLGGDPHVVVVGETSGLDDAPLLARGLIARVVVLATASPDPAIVSTIRASRAAEPMPEVVLVSPRVDEPYVRMSLEAGARGYVLPADPYVGRAVRAVASGGAYFSPEIAAVVRRGYLRRGGIAVEQLLHGLTDLERTVLTCLVHGRPIDRIGAELGLSAAVVVTCRRHIAETLAAHDGAGSLLGVP